MKQRIVFLLCDLVGAGLAVGSYMLGAGGDESYVSRLLQMFGASVALVWLGVNFLLFFQVLTRVIGSDMPEDGETTDH